MAFLAETLVDEWLNRQGYFTVRGLKDGVSEIDLLGVRPGPKGLEACHVANEQCRFGKFLLEQHTIDKH